MPPIYDKPTTDKYDYVVIGGGSAGSGTSVSVFFFSHPPVCVCPLAGFQSHFLPINIPRRCFAGYPWRHFVPGGIHISVYELLTFDFLIYLATRGDVWQKGCCS